jgi:hypothetical protein
LKLHQSSLGACISTYHEARYATGRFDAALPGQRPGNRNHVTDERVISYILADGWRPKQQPSAISIHGIRAGQRSRADRSGLILILGAR